MKSFNRQDIILLSFQLMVWIGIILAPGIVMYLFDVAEHVHYYFASSAAIFAPFALLYFLSFYLLLPQLLEKGRIFGFFLAAILGIFLVNIHFYNIPMFDNYAPRDISLSDWQNIRSIQMSVFLSIVFSLDVLDIAIAYLHRKYISSHQKELLLEEEKRKATEAELVWLKNQLNPHFLFNSLNNISSLTQIDPDRAQEAIAQLSDLLRYALYESQKPYVPLAGEAEFMQNYIAMMKLRCNDKTEVVEDFQIGAGNYQIVPLLFISFIENAFKHGASNKYSSHIVVSLLANDGNIVFECRNTNFSKNGSDHSGSGIGLENTRRRLDLCYPNKYIWDQKIDNNEFSIKIKIAL